MEVCVTFFLKKKNGCQYILKIIYKVRELSVILNQERCKCK